MTGNRRCQGRLFSSVISSIVLTDVSGVAQTRQVAGWFLCYDSTRKDVDPPQREAGRSRLLRPLTKSVRIWDWPP
jgi:hypothetical protein